MQQFLDESARLAAQGTAFSNYGNLLSGWDRLFGTFRWRPCPSKPPCALAWSISATTVTRAFPACFGNFFAKLTVACTYPSLTASRRVLEMTYHVKCLDMVPDALRTLPMYLGIGWAIVF